MEIEVPIQLVLADPPDGVDFGIQKGSGARYETLFVQRRGRNDIRFRFSITAKDNRNDGLPNFLGPVRTGHAGSPVFLRRYRQLRRTEKHGVGAAHQSTAAGHYLGANQAGRQDRWTGTFNRNPRNGKGWRPHLRHGQRRRLENRPRLGEAFARALLRLSRLFLAIAWRRARAQRCDEALGRRRHFFHRAIERVFICTRRAIHSA